MKKILKGSVLITQDGHHYWVVDHVKGFIRAQNEDRKITSVSESAASMGRVIAGKDAMDIIKEYWY